MPYYIFEYYNGRINVYKSEGIACFKLMSFLITFLILFVSYGSLFQVDAENVQKQKVIYDLKQTEMSEDSVTFTWDSTIEAKSFRIVLGRWKNDDSADWFITKEKSFTITGINKQSYYSS